MIVVSIRSQRWFKSHCIRALAAKTRCCLLMLTVLFPHAHCTVSSCPLHLFSCSLSVVSGCAYMRRRPRSVYQQIEQGFECTWHRDCVRPNPQTGVGFQCCCARASSVGELPVLPIMWFCGAFFLPGKHGTGQYYTLEDFRQTLSLAHVISLFSDGCRLSHGPLYTLTTTETQSQSLVLVVMMGSKEFKTSRSILMLILSHCLCEGPSAVRCRRLQGRHESPPYGRAEISRSFFVQRSQQT